MKFLSAIFGLVKLSVQAVLILGLIWVALMIASYDAIKEGLDG